MRSAGGLDSDLVESKQWRDQTVRGRQRYSTLKYELVNGKRVPRISSFSGNERNKLFMNVEGKSFADVSLLSGVDALEDGRCFSIWDYNRDGAQDIALLNMNSPHVQIFKNQFHSETTKNNFIAIQLIGGNSKAEKSGEWSNRDGVGAKVTVKSW